MPLADFIGATGVALLLAGFVLNSSGLWAARCNAYQILNATGAALACYASLLIDFLPFVILEGCWCVTAIAALLRNQRPAIPLPRTKNGDKP